MTTRIHYRLANDPNNEHALWTGAISTPSKVTSAEARRAVAKHLRVEKLPARTLVLTDRELESGEWTADEIRAETCVQTVAPSMKRKVKAPVAFEDVLPSMDDVQAMLKKYGLA